MGKIDWIVINLQVDTLCSTVKVNWDVKRHMLYNAPVNSDLN